MLDLTPDEARLLRTMADDIVEGTQDRAYWLGGARDTSVAILRRIAQWLGDTCDQHRPAQEGPGPEQRPLTCIRPVGHTGRHLDAHGQSWQQRCDECGQTPPKTPATRTTRAGRRPRPRPPLIHP
ncbi:hypothetical protein HDA32_006016 [Spinactinospora alkalitolerans]|uniref:Uncharacterized protein n=1 Tax=Spinactinospora alkalitolerans TaxID=687207 RepID=A0A852U1Z4_9ACTN|nr:hypothetical protein [Spinactinospora alkalitolerans]NYE50896.1 hypothetical protein [Spinactinospora alkalitolerans]